jgi:bifunctional non-homologous end joining protein LigD
MINPMVPRLVRDPFDREGWLFELKWDGFRAIAETDGQGAVKLYSRNQNDFKKRFPPIAQALAEIGRPTILDGEIVALDEGGHPRFEWLVNRGQAGLLRVRSAEPGWQGCVSCPWKNAKLDWRSLLKNHPRLLYVDHVETNGLAMFAGAMALGFRRRGCEECKEPLCRRPSNDVALAEDQEQGL